MTDRGEAALRTGPDLLRIGPSAMRWDGRALTVTIDERTVPHLDRLKGEIRLEPEAVTGVEAVLHPGGSHVWRPFAPAARIAVDLGRPGWRWEGHGYLDANFGIRALEADFRYWTWGRFPLREGTVTFYDALRRDGGRLSLACCFGPGGAAATFDPPPVAALPRSFWRVRRETRADPGFRPRQVLAMLDAPFYARAAIRTRIGGEETTGVHEALDLDRFASPLLKPMLAVRVPRRAGWRGD